MDKLLSISFSILILFGNMGFTLTTHYCGGHAVKTKLAVEQADIGCGMEHAEEPCGNPMMRSKHCCENKYLSMSIEDDFNSSLKQSNLNPVFLFTFAYTYFNLQPPTEATTEVFKDYAPPPLRQSRQVLFQTFLI